MFASKFSHLLTDLQVQAV